jgi:hypothetical protein
MAQTIQQEFIEIDGVRYLKTIVTTTAIHNTFIYKETYFTYKELIKELSKLKEDKGLCFVKASFDRHLKRKLNCIKNQALVLPVPLYSNNVGNVDLTNFYIVQADKRRSLLLFKRIDHD